MLTQIKIELMNRALSKLMRVIGSPDWYQSARTNYEGEPCIILTMNTMLSPSKIRSHIPRDIDGILIKVRYRNPVRFYGKDGSSTTS